jgi:hypothetical protein
MKKWQSCAVFEIEIRIINGRQKLSDLANSHQAIIIIF